MESTVLLRGKGCHTSGLRCTVGDFELWNINQFHLVGFAPLRKPSVGWRIPLSNSLGHFKNKNYVSITMTVYTQLLFLDFLLQMFFLAMNLKAVTGCQFRVIIYFVAATCWHLTCCYMTTFLWSEKQETTVWWLPLK